MSELRDLIDAAVTRAVGKAEHDGPAGVCLSGGIDSSTIATLAPGLPLFTGWYQGAAFDERPYAALVADGRDWTEVEITPADFEAVAEPVCVALAKAGLRCGPGAVGQYVVARAAADQGIATLLTGEGGDELFGGYARQMIVAGLHAPDGYEDYKLPDGYPVSLRGALDLEWRALRDLCRVDETIAGCHGVRVVPPLLDPWLVAHVHSLPTGWRIAKTLLRVAMLGVVPDAILQRTDKRGFPAPFVVWAQGPTRDFVADRIGYVPDPARPWARQWWYDLCDALAPAAVAA